MRLLVTKLKKKRERAECAIHNGNPSNHEAEARKKSWRLDWARYIMIPCLKQKK